MDSKAGFPGIGRVVGGSRLTSVLFGILAGFCLLASVITQERASPVPLEKVYSSDLLYVLRAAHLTDIFHSGWFSAVLILLALNLATRFMSEAPGAWKAFSKKSISILNLSQILSARKKKGSLCGFVGLEIPTELSREEFREYVQAWVRRGLRNTRSIRVLKEGGSRGELQLFSEKWGWSRAWGAFSSLALLGLCVGGGLSALEGFEGVVRLEEGQSVDHLQVIRGAPGHWSPLSRGGNTVPGFYLPGFEIEAERVEVEESVGEKDLKSLKAKLNFRQEGKTVSSSEAWLHHSVSFEGMEFFAGPVGKILKPRFDLGVIDRKGDLKGGQKAEKGAKIRLDGLVQGRAYDLDGGVFRIVDFNPSQVDLGPALEIEYREGNAETERFWIFQNHPRYDEVRRRKSRHHFSFQDSKPGHSLVLWVVKDPGAQVALASSLLFLVFWGVGVLFPVRRYWYSWKPGRIRVVATSSRFALFESTMEGEIDAFLRGLPEPKKEDLLPESTEESELTEETEMTDAPV